MLRSRDADRLIDAPPPGARQGISWRYYAANSGGLWTAPDVIRHMCQPAGIPRNALDRIGRTETSPSIQRRFLQISSKATLHPSSGSIRLARIRPSRGDRRIGPSWVASIVNAIGASAYWNNTVILITWDDWGGWYDHVPPPLDPQYGYYENGFRVPLLVVSAYTPAGYVSQQTHTFGSLLRFTEEAFGLPFIPPGTSPDSRSDDLMDFFNFSAPPRAFVPISAPMGPDFFLHDHRPVTDPDTE